MAKSKHKKAPKKKATTYEERSDIPFLERMKIQKQADIEANRADAANLALKMSCVALNDTEGLGFLRLCRFGVHLMELNDEYWEDREVGEHHLNQRLTEMGFDIGENGRMHAVEFPNGVYKKPREVRAQEEQDS